jgi:hypothetical protein
MSTRRGFLKTGVTSVVGIGTIGSLSGCFQLPAVGSGDGPAFTKWLHTPGEFDDDLEHYGVDVIKPARVISNGDLFSDTVVDRVEGMFDDQLEPAGVDTAALDWLAATNVTTVLSGSYDESTVNATLENNDFEEESEVGGYTVFADVIEEQAFAVGADAIVRGEWVSESATALDVTKEALAVRNGDEPRYTEKRDTMDVLLGALDDGFQISAATFSAYQGDDAEVGWFEDSVGKGFSQSLSDDTSTFKHVAVYEDEGSVDTDDLEEWYEAVEESGGEFATLDDVDCFSSGRTAILEGTVDPFDFGLY